MLKSGAVLTVGAQSVRPGRIRGFPVVSTCGGPWWPLWSLRTGLVLCMVCSLDGSRIRKPASTQLALSLFCSAFDYHKSRGFSHLAFRFRRIQHLTLQMTARITIHFLDHCNSI